MLKSALDSNPPLTNCDSLGNHTVSLSPHFPSPVGNDGNVVEFQRSNKKRLAHGLRTWRHLQSAAVSLIVASWHRGGQEPSGNVLHKGFARDCPAPHHRPLAGPERKHGILPQTKGEVPSQELPAVTGGGEPHQMERRPPLRHTLPGGRHQGLQSQKRTEKCQGTGPLMLPTQC